MALPLVAATTQSGRASAGSSPSSPMAARITPSLERCQQIGRAQPHAPHQLLERVGAAKQPLEPLHRRQHPGRLALAPAFVTAQVDEQADILACGLVAQDLLRQRGSIQQAEVDPLPRQRVYGVGGISHQHQPLAGKVTGITGCQRDGAARPLYLAQTEAGHRRRR